MKKIYFLIICMGLFLQEGRADWCASMSPKKCTTQTYVDAYLSKKCAYPQECIRTSLENNGACGAKQTEVMGTDLDFLKQWIMRCNGQLTPDNYAFMVSRLANTLVLLLKSQRTLTLEEKQRFPELNFLKRELDRLGGKA